jgi:hypothetical protein
MSFMTKNRVFIKTLCSFMAFAFFSVPCGVLASGIPQEGSEKTYGQGRIYNKEGFKIDFKDIKVGENVFVYTDKATGTGTTIAKEDVMKVQVSTGSKAFPYALGYGALMFLGGYVGTMNTGGTGVEIEDSTKLAIAGGVGALGLIIGGIIGSTKTSYKTIYDEKKMGLLGGDVNLLVAGKNGATRVGLNYSF